MRMICNETDYPSPYLRRIVSWVCRQAEISTKDIKFITFANTRTYYFSGSAYRGGLVEIRIGKDPQFPAPPRYQSGSPRWFETREDALVFIIAHEVYHIRQFIVERKKPVKRNPIREHSADLFAKRTLLEYLKNKQRLVEAWSLGSVTKAASSHKD